MKLMKFFLMIGLIFHSIDILSGDWWNGYFFGLATAFAAGAVFVGTPLLVYFFDVSAKAKEEKAMQKEVSIEEHDKRVQEILAQVVADNEIDRPLNVDKNTSEKLHKKFSSDDVRVCRIEALIEKYS